MPLSVRLVTSRGEKHITLELRDLSFRDVAIGGWASARMSLDRPLITQPDEIIYYGRVLIYNTRSAQVVWEGRLEDPGRGVRSDGQIWDLTAMGPAARVADNPQPLFYADTTLSSERWARDDLNSQPAWDLDVGGGNNRITMTVARGTVAVTGGELRAENESLRGAGLLLGRVGFAWDAGVTDANWLVRCVTSPDGGATQHTAYSASLTTTGAGISCEAGGANAITAGDASVALKLIRITADQTVANDDTWIFFDGPVSVRMLLKNAAGVDITSGYSLPTVLASDVVKDLLGRMLGSYDGANAVVATTTYPIDQLAYPDGVDAARVLSDLLMLEPAYRWGAYESNAVGKHRFEWTLWPTQVRYEADVLDGFDSPGSAVDLYNGVQVRWREQSGQIRVTHRTAIVPILADAQLTREAIIDLGDNIGSTAAAIQVGDTFLADHTYPPNAGRLTVARPVLDLLTGRMTPPWEIKAGELIRVRGVLPRIDALNASSRDGVTVFRVWSREYSAASAAATLELDSYAPSTARALASLIADSTTRRR